MGKTFFGRDSQRGLQLEHLLVDARLVLETAFEPAAEIPVFVVGRSLGRQAEVGDKGFAGRVGLFRARRARGRRGIAAVLPDILRVLAAPFDVEESTHGDRSRCVRVFLPRFALRRGSALGLIPPFFHAAATL